MVTTDIEDLVAGLEAPLIRYATRLLQGDAERARDAVQETFLRWVNETAKTPEARETLRGHEREWLYTVCRRLTIDIRRKEQPMISMSEPTTNNLSESGPGRRNKAISDPPRSAEQGETVALALKAMETLPDHQQEVLRLKFHDELSYKEIATVTGLSVGNVGFLIHTGLKQIRACLEA